MIYATLVKKLSVLLNQNLLKTKLYSYQLKKQNSSKRFMLELRMEEDLVLQVRSHWTRKMKMIEKLNIA